MKANKAPEKLYLSDFTDTTESVFYVKQDNTKKADIEYVLKNSFIEKACKWLEMNFNMPNDFEYHFRKAMEK